MENEGSPQQVVYYQKLGLFGVPFEVQQQCIKMLWIACNLLEMDAMQVPIDFIAPAPESTEDTIAWAYPISGYADAKTGSIYIRTGQSVEQMQITVAHECMHLKQCQRLERKGIPLFLLEWAEREAEAFEQQAWAALQRYELHEARKRYALLM